MASGLEIARLALRRRLVSEGVEMGVPMGILAERLGVSVTTVRKDWKIAVAEQEWIAAWRASSGEVDDG